MLKNAGGRGGGVPPSPPSYSAPAAGTSTSRREPFFSSLLPHAEEIRSQNIQVKATGLSYALHTGDSQRPINSSLEEEREFVFGQIMAKQQIAFSQLGRNQKSSHTIGTKSRDSRNNIKDKEDISPIPCCRTYVEARLPSTSSAERFCLTPDFVVSNAIVQEQIEIMTQICSNREKKKDQFHRSFSSTNKAQEAEKGKSHRLLYIGPAALPCGIRGYQEQSIGGRAGLLEKKYDKRHSCSPHIPHSSTLLSSKAPEQSENDATMKKKSANSSLTNISLELYKGQTVTIMDETQSLIAMSQGEAVLLRCAGCSKNMYVVPYAEHMFCATCGTITPVKLGL